MRKTLIRVCAYLLGLTVLAAALTLYTKTGLGVSSILSLPYVISELWGLRFADVTFGFYSLFALVQVAIHLFGGDSGRGRRVLFDLLQLPLSLLFTRVMDLVSAWVPLLPEQEGLFGTFPARIAVLALAVVLTGVGAATTLNMRLIPNPSDGIVQTLSDALGRRVGTVKNCFDAGCVCAALVLGLAVKGTVVGIGLGTLVAALCIGRVIALYNRHLGGALCRAAGVELREGG